MSVPHRLRESEWPRELGKFRESLVSPRWCGTDTPVCAGSREDEESTDKSVCAVCATPVRRDSVARAKSATECKHGPTTDLDDATTSWSTSARATAE